jgi:hypothetical protein
MICTHQILMEMLQGRELLRDLGIGGRMILRKYGVYMIDHLAQWYSTFFVRVPPDIISLQLCTPKVVGV